MIVATLPDGPSFYSNDGQLFSDGDVTIYSPAFLPVEAEMSSTNPGAWVCPEDGAIRAQVVDIDSGSVLWDRAGLGLDEAFEMVREAMDRLTARVS